MTRKTAVIARALTGAFAIVGLVNVLAILLPTRFGDANWELAAFGELAGSLAVPMIGLTLVAFLAASERRFWLGTAGAVACAVLGAVVLVGLLVLGLNLPLLLSATAGKGVSEVQLRLLAVKSMALLVLYSIGLWYLVVNLAQTAAHARRMAVP